MIFNNEEFGQVRTLIINDEPCFVGKDVASALGYKKITEALQTNVDEMDSTLMGIIDSMGRNQQTKVINESVLYALIFGSKLPSAKRFKHWVTSEVLPSIRKTGSYTLTNTDQKKANLLLSIYNGGQEGVLASRELTKIEIDEATLPLKQKIEEKDIQITEMKPKATYFDQVMQCKDLISITNIAKDYGWYGAKLNNFLHEQKVQFKKGKKWYLYQEYANKGYTGTKTMLISNTDTGEDHAKTHMYWTQKGRLFIYALMKKNGIVPIMERESETE